MSDKQEGASIKVTVEGLEPLRKYFERLGSLEMSELLDGIGTIIEAQTKMRIQPGHFQSKRAPDGTEWQQWSERYRRTRNLAKHSLLVSSQALLESITHLVEGDEVRIGPQLVYGRAQQFGFEERNLPARPYLGLSDADQKEIAESVKLWFKRSGKL